MAVRLMRPLCVEVKPLISLTKEESKRRVLQLYKSWQKQLIYIIQIHALPITVKAGRAKIRELFLKNKDVTDIRLIDMLVVKGQMELTETVNAWKQKNHVMAYFKDTVQEKPKDFLGRFLAGQE